MNIDGQGKGGGGKSPALCRTGKMNQVYDLIVIGGGPAGYVGAIKAAQKGMRTVLIEKEYLGGTCLNVGCIPTKTLFQSAELAEQFRHPAEFGLEASFDRVDIKKVMERKQAIVNNLVNGVKYLLKKNKIEHIQGTAEFTESKKIIIKETGAAYEGKNILIAAGSENFVPPVSGFNGKNVISSTQLLSIDTLPESLAIVGGGVIGCEFANIMNSFGVKVTVIEMLPGLLANMEQECSAFIEKEFLKKGIAVHTGAKVLEIKDLEGGKKQLTCAKADNEVLIEAEYVLIATGRKPAAQALALDKAGIRKEKGWIAVNDRMETSVNGVYAAGDITGKSFLAHAAFEEGVIAVENMCGGKREMSYKAIPKAVFVDTELCSCGLTEQEAKERKYDVITGSFQLSANGMAMTMGKTNGFIKVISEKNNHEILGIHMAGPGASEMVATAATLLSMEATLEDVEYTIYPHPSVSEALHEACLAALGYAIHA